MLFLVCVLTFLTAKLNTLFAYKGVKEVTNARVEKLTAIIDVDELEQTIKAQYTYLENDDKRSSLAQWEKMEIVQRKHVKTKSLSSLYRREASSDWNSIQIDTLKNDMEKQLLTLQRANSQPKQKVNTVHYQTKGNTAHNANFKMLTLVDDNSSISIDMEEDSDSHLLGNLLSSKSAHEWDPEAMITTTEEMQKEMISLMLLHQKTVSFSADSYA